MDRHRPGTLLAAPVSEDADPVFRQTVILVVDRQSDGITTGLALNRPLRRRAIEQSALAPLFLPDAQAPVYWGGPLGEDAALLAQLTSGEGLEWFHLDVRLRRPFPLPDVAVVALGEHPDALEGRIRRARLYVGLCVWGAEQLEGEVERGEWLLAAAVADDLFADSPETLWERVLARARARG